ncbi:MAG: P-loop NTPase fold protein [Flavobacteriaceae bacterium]
MSKLLPNLPIIDLNKENDFIGIINKGEIIKSFFLANKKQFSQIKIFSIYGEWGSGKSTLMKYLENNLTGSFNTFFFESWEFESDKNLSLSLLEYLVKNSKTENQEVFDDLLKSGGQLLEGFARSITIKLPGMNISGDKFVSSVEEKDEISFLEQKKNFKNDFENWEKKITEGDKMPDYNLVFIDDLDRCEPENVLNLLSAIKLFFTYGSKTIFVCGVDKKAISEAVKTKYGEVVKSNEYLEKVFDVSFSMPTSLDVSKLVKYYFDEKIVDSNGNDLNLGDSIVSFFEKLHFRNPRRIKKILNKYLIIKSLKDSEGLNNLILPNILHKDSGTFFETYLTLYLLILNEFEPENFKLLFDLSAKRKEYYESIKLGHVEGTSISNTASGIFNLFKEDIINIEFNNYSNNNFAHIIPYFSPSNADNLGPWALSDKKHFITGFNLERKSFEYYFTLFLFENEHPIINDLKNSKYSLAVYKKMVGDLI